MDVTTETKSAAAQFLANHDAVVNELASAKITLDDQRKEIEKQDVTIAMQREALAQSNNERDRYLQYSFEMSAQLQFMVAGSARALMIANAVRTAIANKAADIPPVPGADMKELESIIDRIGEVNAAANDGNGMTNAAPAMTGAGPQDLPKGIEPPPIPVPAFLAQAPLPAPFPVFDAPRQMNGVMVDKDGNPVTPSAASQSLQVA